MNKSLASIGLGFFWGYFVNVFWVHYELEVWFDSWLAGPPEADL